MRPGVAIAASVLVAVGLPGAAAADRVRPDPNIAGLQTALAVKGFYRGAIDGIRGPLTTAALHSLQRQFRLPTSNLADRRTRSALGKLGGPRYGSRALRRGMVGLDVAALQFELRYHGFPDRERGTFGARTLFALKRFQHFAGLPADGVAGRGTYVALAQPPPVAPKLRPPLAVVEHATKVGYAVELACPYATPVAAGSGGTVIAAGNRSGRYGYTVVTRDTHGLEILYAHLARVDVRPGQRLLAGALVGLAGWTGKRRAVTSLRLELRLRGARLNAYAALYGR
jgi:peptidoglycan hydrolase-like protein with peptidoglycan-binding domain